MLLSCSFAYLCNLGVETEEEVADADCQFDCEKQSVPLQPQLTGQSLKNMFTLDYSEVSLSDMVSLGTHYSILQLKRFGMYSEMVNICEHVQE